MLSEDEIEQQAILNAIKEVLQDYPDEKFSVTSLTYFTLVYLNFQYENFSYLSKKVKETIIDKKIIK